ncbi:MAG: hypothetical protein HY689_09295 [Chloroflexi bacterium]|nr:hypothetical protein [Chloroflexota bacterium]
MTAISLGNQAGRGNAPTGGRVLIISEMLYQARGLQRLLEEMGREATLATSEDVGLAYLSLSHYDTVVIDVDMGYRAVDDLATRLRRDHPGSEVAILVGWWDARAVDMRPYCDTLICKPVDPRQIREALERRAG